MKKLSTELARYVGQDFERRVDEIVKRFSKDIREGSEREAESKAEESFSRLLRAQNIAPSLTVEATAKLLGVERHVLGYAIKTGKVPPPRRKLFGGWGVYTVTDVLRIALKLNRKE